VTYEEWTSSYAKDIDPSNVETPPIISGELKTEELKLIMKREAWMISELREIKSLKLDSPN